MARLEVALLGVGTVLVLAISLAHWHTMNPDALSYLEVGEAWWRGDFANAVNGYWSPLYPILIAGWAKLAPSGVHDVALAHLSAVLVFVAAFFSFRWFLHEAEQRIGANLDETTQLNFRLASYGAFFWSCFCLMDARELLPDLLLTVWTLLAGASILRMQTYGWRAGVALGIFLGLGYMTKPVMFPLGLFSLVVAAFSIRPLRRAIALSSIAGLVFLSISALYLIPLSIQKQRPTFSDSGALAYAWEVNHVSPYFHWQGQPSGSGIPKHGTRQILEFPPAYEFDRNRPGTYPLWYDASYWNEGLRPRFVFRDQLDRLQQSERVYLAVLWNQPVPAVLFFSALVGGMSIGWRRFCRLTSPFLPLVLIAAATIALYSLVFIAARYLAPPLLFLAISGLAAYCRARQLSTPEQELWARSFAVFSGLIVLVTCASSIASGVLVNKPTSYRVHAKVAETLRTFGLQPGDKVAVIGRGCDPYFARIGKWRIIAEAPVLSGHPTWPGTTENLDRIVDAFTKETQAEAVVSDVAPLDALDGRSRVSWQRVPGTPYWVHPIKRP